MSLLKSIKQQLGLGPAAENHFWDGSVPNELSLKRGTPDAPGATVLEVDSAGKVNTAVGILGFEVSLGGTGYVKFPSWLGKLMLQWGNGTTNAGSVTLTFATAFDTVFSAVAVATTANVVCVVAALSSSSINILTHTGSTGAAVNNGVRYFAIGVAP